MFRRVLLFGYILLICTAMACGKDKKTVDRPVAPLPDVSVSEQDQDCPLKDEGATVRILAIGNSFSMDATEKHLWNLADAEGIKLEIANLYISGASLQTHWNNAQNNLSAYEYRKIDEEGVLKTTPRVSLLDALRDGHWDFISFQQASASSGRYDTYTSLPLLFEYVKGLVSDCTQFIFHQTWAYAWDHTSTSFSTYFGNDQMKMYNAIVYAAHSAYNSVEFDVFVPAGTAIQNGRTSLAGDHFTRDGYHLDQELGRYTAACTWFEALFEQSVIGNSYWPDRLSEYEAEIAQHAARSAVANPHALTPLEDYTGSSNGPLAYPIYIDFGRNTPVVGWNQVSNSDATSSVFGLTDESGDRTGVSIRILEQFRGYNTDGALNTDITGFDIPSSVSSDSFFGNAGTPWQGITIPQSVFKVWGLDKDLEYSFCFFGSRTGVSDNRETVYEVSGGTEASAVLQTSNNTQQVACIGNMRPNSSGEVLIRVSQGPNNNNDYGFYYINAMRISNSQ